MDYLVASTVEEALALLERGGACRPVAGGTDLAVLIADGAIAPKLLVDVAQIPALRGIRRVPEGVSIGACTTIAEIARGVKDLPNCLVQGARAIGSPQIRNLATIGGNVCNASPCGDTLAPLVALEASFILESRRGRRTVAASDFFAGPKRSVLAEGELLIAIHIAPRFLSGASAFRFIGKRNGQAISQVNAAVWVSVQKGIIRDARTAVGSVAPVPLRLHKAETQLIGQPARGVNLGPVLAAADSEIATNTEVRATLQ